MVKKFINSSLTFSLLFHPFFILAEYPNVPGNGSHPNPWPNTGRYLNPNNDPKNIEKMSGKLPAVPQEIVNDIMTYYPDVAKITRQLNNPSTHQKKLPKQLLLVGPPGVSKTTIAAAIAQVLKRKVIYHEATSLVGNEFQNSGVSSIEKKLNNINNVLEYTDDKYVVVINEIMRLAEKFNNERGEGKDLTTALWTTLDQFKNSNRVFFIATANDIDDLPDQIRSRFDKDEIMKIGLPDARYRKKILSNCLGADHNITDAQLHECVKNAEGLTHRDLVSAVNTAVRNDGCDDEMVIVTYEILKKAIEERKQQNEKSWFQQFNGWCKKNEETITNCAKIGGVALICVGIGAGGVAIYKGVIVIDAAVKAKAAAEAALALAKAAKSAEAITAAAKATAIAAATAQGLQSTTTA